MQNQINQQQTNKNRRLYDFCEECQTYHQATKIGNYLKIKQCEMPIQLTSLVEKPDNFNNKKYHYQFEPQSSTTILSINNHMSQNTISKSIQQLNKSNLSINIPKDNSQPTNNILLNSIVKNKNRIINQKESIYNTPIKNKQIQRSVSITYKNNEPLKQYPFRQNERQNSNLKPIRLNKNWKLETIKQEQQNSIMSTKLNSPRGIQYDKLSQKSQLSNRIDRIQSQINQDSQSFCCGLFGKKSY